VSESNKALTQDEIKQFVTDWYHALDVHVPLEEALKMVADEGLEFHIPEGIKRGHDGFRELYHHWTHTFFDEVHVVKSTDFTVNGDKANGKVVVNWKAKMWTPPEANSQDILWDAYQSWVVQRDPASGRVVILTYILDEGKDLLAPAGS